MTNSEGRLTKEAPSTKAKVMVLALVFAFVAAFWFGLFWTGIHQAGESIRALPEEAAKAIEAAAKLQTARKLPGADILKNYALPSTRPEDDLESRSKLRRNTSAWRSSGHEPH
jgi:hypothetical protein